MQGDGDLNIRPFEFEVSPEPGWVFKIGLDVLPYNVPFLFGGIFSNVEIANLFDPRLFATSEFL